MTTELETAVENAAKIIVEQNQGMTMEHAKALAQSVMAAAGVKFPAPPEKPATQATPRPVAPRLDVAALANVSPAERAQAWINHERELAKYVDVQQSYVEPISEDAIAAKARLLELRAASEADSGALKVQRAMEREKLMETIIAGGMSRL